MTIRSILLSSLLLPTCFFTGQTSIAQSATPTASRPSLCPADLPPRIAAITNRPEFQRARWGILVQTEGDRPRTLFSQESDRYFVPASNAKLFVTAAALTQLGAAYRIRTSVYREATPTGQVVLRVVGRGDPSVRQQNLQVLAQQVRQAVPTGEVDQLIADDRYFGRDAINPTWEWEDLQAGYAAPANSLILNQNLIGLTLVPQQLGDRLAVRWDDPAEAAGWRVQNQSRTVAIDAPEFVQVGRDLSRPILQVRGHLRLGSTPEEVAVAIPQPAQHFLQRWRQALNAEGLGIRQTQILTADLPAPPAPSIAALNEIASIESPPLSELVTEANQNSNNLYAEALLRTIGRVRSPQANQPQPEAVEVVEQGIEKEEGAENSGLEAGLEALQQTLTQLGVDPESYDLKDGSGLSRQNLVSPAALVAVLQRMARSPLNSIYRDSLAVAGNRGTLRNRFRETAVAGHLRGKTGFLTGVAALSGYLDSPHSPPLVVSILVNQANQGGTQAAIDEIVRLLSQLQDCQ